MAISKLLVPTLVVGFAASPAVAGGKKAKPAPATNEKAAPAKTAPSVTEANKKKMEERLAGFKFGMTKDEVVQTMSKQLNERYEEKLKGTTDVAAQDRIRKEKKQELARLTSTYTTFEYNKPSPWDVSIIEGEFGHGTDEAMMERWENANGKNERRFFFFYQGKLWKMFISMDVSIIPEDKRNFDTFQGVMQGLFGPALIEPGVLTWSTPDLKVRALDKLKAYDAIGLTLESPSVHKELVALREAKAPPKKETSSIIKAVVDDKNEKMDVKANSGGVDAVIKAQKAGGK
ncbi:MAG: hypothetical protein SFX73_08635 [Kofleriaceae bacterium]|nr:hypothetical protein [Kofleriaceae bacterium]